MSKKIKNEQQRSSQHGDRQTLTSASSSIVPAWLHRIVEHPRFGWIFAAVYGVVMLGVGLKYHVVGDYNVETDFFWSYVPEAKELLHGKVTIDGFRGPGYSFLLAGMHFIVRDYFLSGIILSTIAGTALLGLTFTLFKTIVDSEKAFIVAALLCINPLFIQYTYTAGTDMVFASILMASVFFFLRSEKISYLNILLAAALAGTAYLIRYNGLVAILVYSVSILFLNMFHLSWQTRFKSIGVVIGMFLLVIFPYGLYCWAEKGSFFYTENYLNVAREMYKDKFSHDQFWMSEAAKFKSTGQVILSNPGLFIQTIVRNIYDHFIGDLSNAAGWPIGIFIIPGFILLWKERTRKQFVTYILLAAGIFGILLLLLQQPRYSLFLLPAYILIGSLTLTWPGLKKFTGGKSSPIVGIVFLVLLVWTMVDSYNFNLKNIDSGPQEVPLIADWFNKNYGRGNDTLLIVTRKPHIAYYLGMSMIAFPLVQNEQELHEQIKTNKASYLFFSTMEAHMRPQFQSWLDPRNAPAWLTPVTYTISPPAVLYKINLDNAK
jgi:hypothetical protein